jgi:hypothetical protein
MISIEQKKRTLLFRARAGEPVSPFVIEPNVEIGRLPAGGRGGKVKLGGAGDDPAFWDTKLVLRSGGAGAGVEGGAILRRAGGPVRIGGDPLAETALGRAGRRGGARGEEGLEDVSPPPGCSRVRGVGATREGADEMGLAGGGGGGALPGMIDPAAFRAGKAGGDGTLRAGSVGAAGVVVGDREGGDCFRGGIAGAGRD